jgi:hypothetical protein
MSSPENKTPAELAKEERKRLQQQYGSLFDDISSLLFRNDPIGIVFEDNKDEYDPETRTILPKLNSCRSEEDVLQVVHKEFCRWFSADIAGPTSRYTTIAAEIWSLWKNRK